jgi:tetratricopeptide (TPR) repeat protein
MAHPVRSRSYKPAAALDRLARAEALAARGELAAAGRSAAAVARQHPALPEAWRLKGTLALLQDRAADAVQALRRAVALAPDDAASWVNLGIAQERAGADAEASLRRALELQPALPQAHYNLGVLLRKRGRLDEAVDHLGAAVATAPDYVNAQEELGRALLARGDHAQAIDPLRAALARPSAALALGLCLQETSALDEAIGVYRRLLRQDRSLYGAVVKNLSSAARGRVWLRPADLRRALFDDPG